MHPDDEELIRGFLQGEPKAVQVIEGWIAKAAWSFQPQLTTQWPDVLQEIRLELIRVFRAGDFRGEARLKTYLWQIASHICVNQLRAEKEWQRKELPYKQWQVSEDSPASEEIRLLILEDMPTECRQLWAMILDGLSYQQMSQRLDDSETALRQRVLRCLKLVIAARDRSTERK